MASDVSVAATVETVTVESFDEEIDAPGIIAVRAGHVASLSAPAPTRITAIYVVVGSRVTVGQRLVSFEPTTFDAAVASADAALQAADMSAQRARRLVEGGVAPRKDLELATADLAAARAASVMAHRTQQLALLQSPINGVVTRMDAMLGANSDVGQSLIEITDVTALDVVLNISPALASNVRAGQRVVIREGAANGAAVIANGSVSEVSAVLDSTTRGVRVRVAVTNHTRVLRIGENVFGQVRIVTHANALVVPEGALVPTGESFQVFVVDTTGRAHATQVAVGARRGHRVWITNGLKAGDKIVTTGAYGMDDGATVQPPE